MYITKANINQLDHLMSIYDRAREFMAHYGNTNQWINGYPPRELIESEIDRGCLYVCCDDSGEVLAAFSFAVTSDPTYDIIYDGAWLNDEPYGVVHRLVSSGKVSRIGDYCMEWCFEQHPNIRVDTHEANIYMQGVILRLGYTQCGMIRIANGTLRIAYQKVSDRN